MQEQNCLERIGGQLPKGPADPDVHRGARRRSTRYPLNAEVSIIEPVMANGVTLNASAGGIRFAVDRAIPVGDLCVLEVRYTPDRMSIERGRVVWARVLPDGWLIGLEFVGEH